LTPIMLVNLDNKVSNKYIIQEQLIMTKQTRLH